MEDIAIVRQISAKIKITLKEVSEDNFTFATNGYTIKDGRVTGLNIYNLKLSSFPIEIFNLWNIRKLFASFNQFEEIPSEIAKLPNLQQVTFSHNKINSIPKNIGNLRNLSYFDLAHNQIEELPPELLNSNLEIYYENDIFKIRRGLNLYDNPLMKPPLEVVKQGKQSIKSYFDLIQSEDTTLLNEAKLLIVGQGGVGKTSLLKSLVSNGFNEREISTEGIDIEKWTIAIEGNKSFDINLWDFGGQEIYYSTHQFFLTKRSLYLFVWEARKDDDLLTFDYWLNVIKLLSDNSPVIIVLNKVDERLKNIDEQSLKRKFGNIVAFHKVSAKSKKGITELSNTIKKEILKLYHTGDILPLSWQKIRTELENINENYITYERYLSICESFELDFELASYVSRYLHDLGVFLHFEDNPVLKDIIFLKPEWATNAVYKVIDSKQVQNSFGELQYNDFKELWEEYPKERHTELLELMKKFELCLQVPNTNTFIIPELLSPIKPDFEWNYKDNLKFEYHYEFMPSGIITRLIVRTDDLNKNKTFWKNGVILQLNESKALIESDSFRRTIQIWLQGEEKSELLLIIRRELGFIHESMNFPEVNEMLPCICKECRKNDTPHTYNYDYLERLYKKNKNLVICQNSLDEVSIEKLLGVVNAVSRKEINSAVKEKKRFQILTTVLGSVAFLVSLISILAPKLYSGGTNFQLAIFFIALILVVIVFLIKKNRKQ